MVRLFRLAGLFLLLGLSAQQLGCGPQTRVCSTDQDCLNNAPKLFCFKGVCDTRQCEPGEKNDCYEGAKETLGTGPCRGGLRVCLASGRWSPCLEQFLPQEEICDRIDNDCNGKLDELPNCQCPTPGTARRCYNGPKDTQGVGNCRYGVQFCLDDNLWGRCRDIILPENERCDGQDNDCNGKIDDHASCTCTPGAKQPCYSGPPDTLKVGPCQGGIQTCNADGSWGECTQETRPTEEVCGNGVDDDCDGQTDQNCTCEGQKTRCADACVDLTSDTKHCGACGRACPQGRTCNNGACQCPDKTVQCGSSCVDLRSDNKHCGTCDNACASGTSCCASQCIDPQSNDQHCGTCNNACTDETKCNAGACKCTKQVRPCWQASNPLQGNCKPGKQTCTDDPQSGQGSWSACTGESLPGAEACNGEDDDCDGKVDEDDTDTPLTRACYTGPSGTDGKGICKAGTQTCTQGTWSTACIGELLPKRESCNTQGSPQDENCDGAIDEGCNDAKNTCTPSSILNTLAELTDQFTDIAIDPQGGWFVAGYQTGQIKLWNLKDLVQGSASTALPFAFSRTSAGPITALQFSPDGKWIGVLQGTTKPTAMLWEFDPQNPSVPKSVSFLPVKREPLTLTFSAKGDLLAIGAKSGHIELWDLKTKTHLHDLQDNQGPQKDLHTVSFHPSGTFLFSIGGENTLYLWHTSPGTADFGKLATSLPLPNATNATLTGFALHPNGDSFVIGLQESAQQGRKLVGTLQLSPTPTLSIPQDLPTTPAPRTIAFNTLGTLVASSSGNPTSTIFYHNTQNQQQLLQSFAPPTLPTLQLVWHPTTNTLAANHQDKVIFYECTTP